MEEWKPASKQHKGGLSWGLESCPGHVKRPHLWARSRASMLTIGLPPPPHPPTPPPPTLPWQARLAYLLSNTSQLEFLSRAI
jgi:hypothetical protein